MTQTDTVTVEADGLTLDLVLWRAHGVAGQALLEETLDINPGLAAMGPYLPIGTRLRMPGPPRTSPRTEDVVTLFG